jgi:hypothetical protein
MSDNGLVRMLRAELFERSSKMKVINLLINELP